MRRMTLAEPRMDRSLWPPFWRTSAAVRGSAPWNCAFRAAS